MSYLASFLTFGIFGLFAAGYITYNRTKNKHMVCPVAGSCDEVVGSKWGHMFFINNDVLGVIYYLLIIGIGIYIGFFQGIYFFWAKIITLLAFLFSMFLLHIQINVLKKYCFYCILSAIINFLILLHLAVL